MVVKRKSSTTEWCDHVTVTTKKILRQQKRNKSNKQSKMQRNKKIKYLKTKRKKKKRQVWPPGMRGTCVLIGCMGVVNWTDTSCLGELEQLSMEEETDPYCLVSVLLPVCHFLCLLYYD